ncbi:MAG: dethiobiotin synthase [Methylococcales bacterium]|nr:dethiobiotin synthase [Methylococcales bacterium]
MEAAYFITGTDTDVGKTVATLALMHYIKQQGKTVIGMKPVAAGCELHNGQLKNQDALLLQAAASVQVDYELLNPYAYLEPVSPHIAGARNPVALDKVRANFNTLTPLADIVLVEGAGGWYAPINDHQAVSDLAQHLALPVIMVVAIRLGCINHARLTYQAIQASGVTCAGWIANCTDPAMLKRDENITTIKHALNAPLLGILPYQHPADFDFLARCVSLNV